MMYYAASSAGGVSLQGDVSSILQGVLLLRYNFQMSTVYWVLPRKDKDIEMPKLLFLFRPCVAAVGIADILRRSLVSFSLSSSTVSIVRHSVVPIALRNDAMFTSSPSPLSFMLFFKKALLKIGANELEVKAKLETIEELLLALLYLPTNDGYVILLFEPTEFIETALVENEREERGIIGMVPCLGSPSDGETLNKDEADAFLLCVFLFVLEDAKGDEA